MGLFDSFTGTKGKRDEVNVPNQLMILPLRNSVLFPGAVIPLSVGRQKSLRLVEEAMGGDKIIGVVAQQEASVDDPEWREMFEVGTAAKILKAFKMNDGAQNLVVQGLSRFRLVDKITRDPYHLATIETVQDKVVDTPEVNALYRNLKHLSHRAIELSPNIPDEANAIVNNIEDPNYLVYLVVANLNIEVSQRQAVLETYDTKKRIEMAIDLLTTELQVLELSHKIQSNVKSEMDKNQREYYLREQMKAIRKELGDSDDRTEEIEELRAKIEEAGMPEEARKAADHELDRLTKMPPASAEYTVSRTYLDWLVDVPWSKSTEDKLNIREAEEILEEDHYGLKKVKQRILEFLAVRKLKEDIKGPILCFVGPPGVGKTSLGRSIARAMGRKFIRVSLGGIRDEAEIRGHRRTYVGALPGKVIQSLKKVGSNNPVFMLDEIDKLGSDFRGDPSSALLEVLDPEQNDTFVDHYLDLQFDLSKVLFIGTANILEPIPPALKDRMEVIELPGYTEEEKLEIAKKYLVPRQVDEHGLSKDRIEFPDKSLDILINSYTREAGLRNLEREIAAICRAVAKDVAIAQDEAEKPGEKKVEVNKEEIRERLGHEKFQFDVKERISRSGIATGLAWTPTGGDILFIEATSMRGKGELRLTGQLGDVMKESATAALSFIRANAAELGIDEEFFEKRDIHIHVPAGATPKDGPSAGVTILSALASLVTGKLVRDDIAMTGEVTLRGLVLPVGGIKEKVLAARRAGIHKLILPQRNEKDVSDIPDEVKKDMEFTYVKEMAEHLKLALKDEPVAKRPGKSGRGSKTRPEAATPQA